MQGVTRTWLRCGCNSASRFEFVDKLLDDGQPLSGHPKVYMHYFRRLAGAGNWEKACALLARMWRDHVAPDVITCSAVIDACGHGSRWDMALHILHVMRGHAIAPDDILYTTLLTACRPAAAWEQALSLLFDTQMRTYRLDAGMIHFGAAISICEVARNWELALALMLAICCKRLHPNAKCYGAAISACEKGKQWERAMVLLTDMEQMNVPWEVTTCNAAISACEKVRRWRVCLALIDCMERVVLVPSLVSYSAAMSACDKAREWTAALLLFAEQLRAGCGVDEVAFHAAIGACEGDGQWARAVALLKVMPKHHVMSTVQGYNATISACSKGSEWERSLSLLFDLENHLLLPSTITFSSLLYTSVRWNVSLALLSHACSVINHPDLVTLRRACESVVMYSGPASCLAAVLVFTSQSLVPVSMAPLQVGEEASEALMAVTILQSQDVLPRFCEHALRRRAISPAISVLRAVPKVESQTMRSLQLGHRLHHQSLEVAVGLGHLCMRVGLEECHGMFQGSRDGHL